MFHKPIDRDFAGVGDRAQVPSNFNQVAQRGILFHFVNSRSIHRPGDGHQWPNVRNVKDIARLKANIFRLIAFDQKIVEIEIGYRRAIAADLNVPQRALCRWAAGNENRIDQSAQRTDGISSRIAGVAHHHYLNGAKAANVDSETEILECFRNLILQVFFQISVVNASHGNLPNLWDIDLSRTVNDNPQGGLNLAPNFDLQFVAWTDNVIAGNLHPVHGRECAGRLNKQRLPE